MQLHAEELGDVESVGVSMRSLIVKRRWLNVVTCGGGHIAGSRECEQYKQAERVQQYRELNRGCLMLRLSSR